MSPNLRIDTSEGAWHQRLATDATLRLTPAEQDAIFDANIVRDFDEVPEEFLARVRARFEAHLAGIE